MTPRSRGHASHCRRDGSGRKVWIFHSGALGDFVMTWPLVRALTTAGDRAWIVADLEKAKLAERMLGVHAVGAEARRFTRLWTGEAGCSSEEEREHDVELVITFVANEGSTWMRGARGMFPEARIVCAGAPGSPSRNAMWDEFDVSSRSRIEPSENPAGAVVLHVGAGGEAKRWSVPRWAALAERLRARGRRVDVIAGEVEAERLSPEEFHAFQCAGGRFVSSLDELAEIISAARIFVGADTGPTHLAAQIGVRTVALFGPTDPRVWAPAGPRVRVVAPDVPSGMEWLSVERVIEEVAARESTGGTPAE